MRFDLDTAQHHLSWDELVARARLADDADAISGIWVFDHLVPLYGDSVGPCMEAYTLLAALAASTSNVRLGALVTGVTYRNPSLLMAAATTVDHVSAGRLELGIGAAWHEPEHRAFGFEFPSTGRRIDLLEDAVVTLKRLWTEDDVTHAGSEHSLDGATYRPRPVQQPHPPILLGAQGERRTIPMAGRLADRWHAFGGPDDIERLGGILDRAAREAGRDPSEITRVANLDLSRSDDDIHGAIEAYRDVGVGLLICGWPTEGRDRVEHVIDRVLPEHAG